MGATNVLDLEDFGLPAAGVLFKRPLNFLHLTTFYPPYHFGGDAMYIYRLSHALGDQGHHVEVVHCLDAYRLLHPEPPPMSFASHANVKVHGLHSGARSLSPILTQQTGAPWLKKRQIQEVLRSRTHDVVHFHNISLLGPDVLSMVPPRTPVALYTAHEHWLICPTHVLWKFNSRPCETPECLRCTMMAHRPPQLWRYTGKLARASRHIDRFLSPSRFTARMHAERGFARPVGCLPYFIDRADGDWRKPDPRPQERPYFLFVGRLEKIKGLQTLIALWDRVANFDLLVAGAGEYEAALRQQTAGNPRIKFLGLRSQRELGALYYHAVACLVPSLTYETFGMIIIEAFARKTPAIVRDLGALPEVVNEAGGGFVYQTDEQLLEAILRLGSCPALRMQLGQRGYDAFVRLWSTEAHLAQYFELLHAVATDKVGHVPWEAPLGT